MKVFPSSRNSIGTSHVFLLVSVLAFPAFYFINLFGISIGYFGIIFSIILTICDESMPYFWILQTSITIIIICYDDNFWNQYFDYIHIFQFFNFILRITQVDHQVGLVQKILCDKDELAHQNSCHLLEGTICHLLQHCGDSKHRFSKCEYDVDISAVAPSVISFAWAHRWLLSPTAILLTLMVAFAIVPELL